MTPPPAPRSHEDEDWSAELTTFLGPACFPAAHDDLAAILIQHHAPSRLLWHLSVLPRARQFASLHEVIERLGLRRPPTFSGSGTDWP
jgi:hypothetical protein